MGVQWANLYRAVRIHETVFDLLSEEYETARIDEAKSIPTVGIVDFPSLPERKSSPHRFLIVLISTVLSVALTAIYLLSQRSWLEMAECDTRRALVARIKMTMHNGWS
ncbi:GNVR domain-containing protein [Tunturiibacter gelidiferens]|uniref:GNVR domain-containing protein n=1 Tax=Tunturiibacter gelidiferens TaxID=3069689 RepID=UPI003D9B2331